MSLHLFHWFFGTTIPPGLAVDLMNLTGGGVGPASVGMDFCLVSAVEEFRVGKIEVIQFWGGSRVFDDSKSRFASRIVVWSSLFKWKVFLL